MWAGLPAAEFATRRRAGLDQVFADVLAQAAPGVEFPAAERVGPLRGFPGVAARLRRPVGDGWALVGDAGSFKDPLTAHGITDALRDAELLIRAVVDGTPADYAATRDALTLPLLQRRRGDRGLPLGHPRGEATAARRERGDEAGGRECSAALDLSTVGRAA